jgi:hypothetical protein
MSMVRISSVKPLNGFQVELKLTTGEIVQRDLRPFLKGPIFDSIREHEDQFSAGACSGWDRSLAKRRRPLSRRCDLGRIAASRLVFLRGVVLVPPRPKNLDSRVRAGHALGLRKQARPARITQTAL